ncbi:universal stress protein [Actinosynnema sp. NPDC047251]|uniref:UspA domain protein n=1 Tax=Saccharothrix espanaensis (strain ATCC 51144 / DSM 44229 / JCM 9112 / NBRC 15066 / NRRL 15764) TaxID=1179773 RepID=K0K3J6_SACES|nr:universal stress protein [Saccharothrix espanaensis]CCH32901.1 UspA domain protein [Saccharothrix espanaensis DSM 44229]
MILVGVDGSPASRKALKWALEHAKRSGETVEATMAYAAQEGLVPANTMGLNPYGETPHRRHPARDLHSIVEDVRATVPDAPSVAEVTVTGDAGTALSEASRQADLLVVGTRGHGRLAEVFLGSVAADCLRHTACPVVVVPPDA